MARHNLRRELLAGTYAFTIEKWSYRYSFRATNAKASPRDAYADNRELLVVGTLTHPRRSIGRKIEVTFRAEKSLKAEHVGYYPDSVGWFIWSRNAKAFSGSLTIAEDALPGIVSLLIAGKLRHVLMKSSSPFKGRLELSDYELIEEITDDYFE